VVDEASLPDISKPFAPLGEPYVAFKRDPETLARTQAIPGQPGLEHRIGGIEKNESGAISYDSENHSIMSGLRAAKIAGIAKSMPPQEVTGARTGKLLVIGWGGTYGAITTAVEALRDEGHDVSSTHLRYLNPLPPDLGDIIKGFDQVLVPELNLGQLSLLIRGHYLVDAKGMAKVQGKPFKVSEIREQILELLTA
jgi:2-oxoglutarate ferredoxin oxidoreductase subunit alpha